MILPTKFSVLFFIPKYADLLLASSSLSTGKAFINILSPWFTSIPNSWQYSKYSSSKMSFLKVVLPDLGLWNCNLVTWRHASLIFWLACWSMAYQRTTLKRENAQNPIILSPISLQLHFHYINIQSHASEEP